MNKMDHNKLFGCLLGHIQDSGRQASDGLAGMPEDSRPEASPAAERCFRVCSIDVTPPSYRYWYHYAELLRNTVRL